MSNKKGISFIALVDTPDDYTGYADYFIRVKSTEDGLEFVETYDKETIDSWNLIKNYTLTQDLDAAGFKIINLANPTDSQDAVTKSYVDTNFAPIDHTHTRGDITDFWDSPFWDNIPDKPSEYPPEPHTHSPSDISPQGSGSGLDADMVDGKHASDFALVDHTHDLTIGDGSTVQITYSSDETLHFTADSPLSVSFDDTNNKITFSIDLSNYYTKSEADSRFVNVSGDSMTGQLTITAGGPQLTLQQTTSGYAAWIKLENTTDNVDWRVVGDSSPIEFRIEQGGTVRFKVDSIGTAHVYTDYGYARIGPQNTGYCHFVTDRNQFYFNKQIVVNGHIVRYHNDQYLRIYGAQSGVAYGAWLDLYSTGYTSSKGEVHIGLAYDSSIPNDPYFRIKVNDVQAGTTSEVLTVDKSGGLWTAGNIQVGGDHIKDSGGTDRIILGEHTRIMPRYIYAGRYDNILGLAPIIMSNAFGFNPPYKVELYDPDAGTWSDITGDYTWEYITDLKGTEVAISVSANKDYMLRFYFDVDGWNYGDITAIVFKMRHISTLKQVKVESSSYSDFSSDVTTHLDWSGNISHWDETTVWRLDSRTSGKRYIRVTIKFSRGADGAIRIREIMGLSYANVASILERWLPIDWDYNKNIFISGSVGIGTTSPSYPLDVSGNARVAGKLYILTSGSAPLFIETDDTGGQLYTTFGTGRWGGAYDFKFGSGAGTWKAARITPARGGSSSSKGAGMLQLFDADSEKVRISASSNSYFLGGNVGIGTSSPSAALDVSGDIKASGTVYGNGEPYAKATFPLLEDYESSYHSYYYGGPDPISCKNYTIKDRYFPAGQLAKSTNGLFIYAIQGYYSGVGGDLIIKIVTPDGTTYSRTHGLSTSAKIYYGEISIPSSKLTNGLYKLELALCSYYDDISGQGSTTYGRVLGAYLIIR